MIPNIGEDSASYNAQYRSMPINLGRIYGWKDEFQFLSTSLALATLNFMCPISPLLSMQLMIFPPHKCRFHYFSFLWWSIENSLSTGNCELLTIMSRTVRLMWSMNNAHSCSVGSHVSFSLQQSLSKQWALASRLISFLISKSGYTIILAISSISLWRIENTQFRTSHFTVNNLGRLETRTDMR